MPTLNENVAYRYITRLLTTRFGCEAADCAGHQRLHADIGLSDDELLQLVIGIESDVDVNIDEDTLGSLATVDDLAKLIKVALDQKEAAFYESL